jgi:hypothetical protein
VPPPGDDLFGLDPLGGPVGVPQQQAVRTDDRNALKALVAGAGPPVGMGAGQGSIRDVMGYPQGPVGLPQMGRGPPVFRGGDPFGFRF